MSSKILLISRLNAILLFSYSVKLWSGVTSQDYYGISMLTDWYCRCVVAPTTMLTTAVQGSCIVHC